MGRTRIGMLGAGYVAGRHLRHLTTLPDVELVGVADPRRDRADALAREAGCAAYGTHEDLLDRDLDALYVCVPPAAHGEVELEALHRGVALLVEKPLSVDLATAEKVAAAVEESGVLVAVGYHWRYLETFELAQRLLAERPARLVLGTWLDKAPRTDWWASQGLSGGQTAEQVTHLFDVARVLVGEVTDLYAAGVRSASGPGDILHASTATLRFDTGAVGSFSSTCVLRGGYRIGVELFADGLALRLSEAELVVDDGSGRTRTCRAEGDAIAREDRAFVQAVRGEDGEGIRCGYAEALRTHRLALEVSTAALAGAGASVG